MRRIDDEEDMVFDQRQAQSTINNRFRFAQKKKSSKSIWIVIITAIVIYTITTYYLVDLIGSNMQEDKVAQLEAEVVRVRQEEKRVVAKIENLQKELAVVKTQAESLKKQIVEKGIAAQTKSETTPTPQPNNSQQNDESKKGWITSQLKAISQKRSQKGGMVKTPSGTVCELKLLMKNSEGKTIDQVIYNDDEARKKRIQFQQQRIKFLSEKSNFQSLSLVKYNMKYDESSNEQEKRVDVEEYNRIKSIHELEKYPEEIPMCVVVPGYNNNAKFRLEYNLNSIFLQNYTNYFIVIINDASTDGSDELFRKYLHFYNIDKSKYAYIENKQRHTALENIYTATHYYCSNDSVVINLDGDDEFIGKNVLKMFNAGYQRTKAGVLYSNFYWYEQGGNLMLGFTSQYTDSEKKSNSYRQAPQRFSHLRSYRAELFRKIEAKDFQDDQGKFYTIAYDMVMYFPLMELSCGRISKIGGYHYLYNINTGLNDYQVDRNKQASVDQRVRGGKKYTCDEDWNKRMSG